MSTPSEVQENTNENEATKPTPKRRGRKRKSEILACKIEEIIEKKPEVETVSRRGRRRKKVNYYELANPDNLEDLSLQSLAQDQNFGPITDSEDSEKDKKRKIDDDTTTLDAEDSFISVIEADNSVDSAYIAKNIDESPSAQGENCVNNTHDADNGNTSFENGGAEDGDDENEPSTSTPKNKDKKYNYTGETVKMMNTLFNFFNKKGDETPTLDSTNNTSNDSISHNISKSTKRPYHKKKKREQATEEKEKDLDDGSGNVTCAICNSTVEKQLWRHHKQRYHNNLAWRVGDPPLDLQDQSFVMHTLNLLYKKKKPLYCDTCGEVKKSVVGFLSHRSQCGQSIDQLESVKISCKICGRKMLPVSLSTHMKTIHMNPPKEERVYNNSDSYKPLPSKRSAAKKAIRIIENVTKTDINKDKYYTTNLDFHTEEFAKKILEKELQENKLLECKFKCNFVMTEMEDILKHIEECPEKPLEGFACMVCLLVTTKLEEIIYHIEFVHDISVDVDDSTEKNFSNSLPSFISTNIRKTERVLFKKAFEWTYQLFEENFTESIGFGETISWPILPPDLVPHYLPKLNESCDVSCINTISFVNPLTKTYTFKRYQLFESELHHDNKLTIFCGGPISSLAWLPTHHKKKNENQILAVAVLNCPDDKYITNDNFNEKGTIQLWNLGVLNNKKQTMREAVLQFGIGVDFGPVWHMEWCPSGGCNGGLGALAVTGSDSAVYIFSIPSLNDEISGVIYKPNPVMKLVLQRPKNAFLGDLKYYPTKISWSKAKGHKYVSVGYTNGFLALFNISSSSKLLRYEENDITCVLPIKSFQAHSHAVTALTLFHLNEGCRWLFSASIDRKVCVWDLHNYNYPVYITKKNVVTDGFWFTNWLCNITGSDEGSTAVCVTALLNQICDFNSDSYTSLTCSPSTISTVSGSDWLNGIVHGNTVGEIIAVFPHQVLQISDNYKVLKSKRLLFGYTHLIEKNKTPEEQLEAENNKTRIIQKIVANKKKEATHLVKIKSDFNDSSLFCDEPILYESADEKYALLFCDNPLHSYADLPKSAAIQLSAFSKFYSITSPNMYPMNAINKIVFNPNRQASLYYATGYQAGFVRISWMEFLKEDQQIE